MNRWWPQIARRNIPTDVAAENVSQFDLLPFQLQSANGFVSLKDHEDTICYYRGTVERQLEILRRSLDASAVVLLWLDPFKLQLNSYVSSASHDDPILPGPFDRSSGIFGALKDNTELIICPYRPSSPAIPYYVSTAQVGCLYARKIVLSSSERMEEICVLCIDRNTENVWSRSDHELIGLTVEQIKSSLGIARDQIFINFDRKALQQVFNGLQILNAALDSESVYAAAVEALGHIVETDIVAIGSVDCDWLQLDFISDQTVQSSGQDRFSLEDSIAGQVVKYRRTLPDSAAITDTSRVINGLTLFNQYKSLLIVPLSQEEGPVSGVLLMAAGKKDRFPRHCRELIEMIASQVAIKLDLARAHDQINAMAITDTLTGIANRRAFQRGFSAMYERALRRASTFSLVVGDIDLFKRINDSYGHPFGDQVIRAVAEQLNDIVRVGDLAARIGGEEFAILLEDTDKRGALEVAERLRKKVEKLELWLQQKKIQVTISLGVSSFPSDTDNREKLFNFADQALYRAKERGRNQTVCWDETL